MKPWASILIVLLLGACGKKTELSIENASREVCECFSAETNGTVDDKLSPCLQRVADRKSDDSGTTESDAINFRMSQFILDMIVDLIQTCDNYFVAINDLYDNGYPLDTTSLNRSTIKELSNRTKTEGDKDSLKALLHKKVYRLIQSREFDLALQSIDSIKFLDNVDYGANLASAYIFNQKGLYDEAVTEIEKAIKISGNELPATDFPPLTRL